MIKAVKVLSIFSTLLFAAVLLLVYAYLPISVDLVLDDLPSIHKQSFFYQTLIIFVVIGVLLRLIINVGFKQWQGLHKAWLNLLILIVNFYLTVLVGFIGVWNNDTHIEPSTFNYLNFIGPVLLGVWVVGLIFLVFKKQ